MLLGYLKDGGVENGPNQLHENNKQTPTSTAENKKEEKFKIIKRKRNC